MSNMISISGHQTKHGRLKVCVTTVNAIGEQGKEDNNGNTDKENNTKVVNQNASNHTVCQIVKLRVVDNLHACSSCDAKDCTQISVKMFKQVSID
jgi:hypothetical protein